MRDFQLSLQASTWALAVAMFAGTHMPASAAKPTHPLNDTGMLKCLDERGVASWDCAGTGQDAEFGRDVQFPSEKNGRMGFAFSKVCNSGAEAGTGSCTEAARPGAGPDDWGCTRDKTTGLTWELKTDDNGLHDKDRAFYLSGNPSALVTFVIQVNAAGHCGATDWRVPTPQELRGLANYIPPVPPLIDANWFPDETGRSYWADGSASRDFFSFYSGRLSYDSYNDEGPHTLPVRLVRGPRIPAPADRFRAKNDEVTDTATGLIWRRCSEGQAWTGQGCGQAAARSFNDWHAALAHAANVKAETGLGWRLPNIKELASLVEYGHTPTINTKAFPGTARAMYWTSTAYLTGGGHIIDFDRGYELYVSNNRYLVRLVRDPE